MSKYSIKIITKTEEKSVQLAQGNTTNIQAEDNAKYQIFNEKGEMVDGLNLQKINENDLAVYLENGSEPAFILEDYYLHYPIEDSAYLSEISASLATTSSEAPFVLASEVASVGISSKILYGLGAMALIGGGIALAGGSGGSNNSTKKAEPAVDGGKDTPKTDDKKDTPTTPKDDQPTTNVEPIKVTVSLNPITTDNTVNVNESGGDVVVSGNFTTDKPFSDAQVWLEVGGQRFKATINQSQFSAKIPGSLLANHQQIKAIVDVENGKSKGSAEDTQNYSVDTDIAAPTLVIDKIATDDIINAVEARADTITITGSAVNGASAEAKAGDKVVLQVGGLRVEGTLDAQLKFSIPVSTIALVNHKSVAATLVTSDSAENSATATANRSVEVDTGFNLSVSVDRIAIDDVVNRAESQNNVTLSGTYTADSDVKNGSVVIKILVNGLEHQAVVNETNKTWTLSVSGQDLATEQGDHSITAKIQAQDKAGNENSATSNHQYRVDTVIDKPVVRITSIAEDDLIDLDEMATGEITIRGEVDNAEGDNPVILLCPCSSCATGWKEVEAQVINGQFEVKVDLTSVALANARLKAADRVIKANYKAKDDAGNSATADETSRNYTVEPREKEINITKIGDDFNVLPASATTRIHGSVEKFATTNFSNNALINDVYNTGQNSRLIRMVKVIIGEKTYQAGFNGEDKSFVLDIPNEDLAGLAGKTISFDWDFTIDSNPQKISYHRLQDVNVLQKTGDKQYRVARASSSGVIPKAQEYTLTSDILEENNGVYTVKAQPTAMTEISGVVKGDVAVGAEIEIKVGENRVATTRVLEGKTFKVDVETAVLLANPSKTVTASLIANPDVRDVETYLAVQNGQNEFVSPHTEVLANQRQLNHTQDNYNFFYPIARSEMGAGKDAFLRNIAFGSTGETVKIKYHFATTEELAAMPTNTQGFEITTDGTRKGLGAKAQEFMRYIYSEISKYTNLEFEEVSLAETRGTNATLLYSGNFKAGTYAASSPAIGFGGGNVIISTSQADGYESVRWNDSGVNGNYVRQLFLHEILHTLGLDHTHDRMLRVDNPAHVGEDTTEFSNLSYHRTRLMEGFGGMRMFDLAYLHYRFGVNKQHRAGNDVYTFKTYDFTKPDGDVYIWDGAGSDTFDASAETEGVTVNLTPGSWIYRGDEKKYNFIVKGRTTYNSKSYFGLAADDTVTGQLYNWNSFILQLENANAGQDHISLPHYETGQAFIGYGTQIENLIGSAYKDSLIGNNADNNIFGGAGDDNIAGGAGNDFINGGLGIDVMLGQDGHDTYVVDNAADVVTEELNQGTDHVYSFIDYTLEENVENLTLVGLAATEGTGNALNNEIRGNDVGNTLKGMDGNDTLIGGLGADTLTGGNGNDIFVFESTLNGKADTITDFVVGEDKIKLSADIFSSLNAGLTNLNDHLFYDQATGELSYNSAATGINNSVHFATVTGLQSLEADRFILG